MSARGHDTWSGGPRLHKRKPINADSIQQAVNNYTNAKKPAATTPAKQPAAANTTKKTAVAKTNSIAKVAVTTTRGGTASKAKSAAVVSDTPPEHKTSSVVPSNTPTYSVPFASQGNSHSVAVSAVTPVTAKSAAVTASGGAAAAASASASAGLDSAANKSNAATSAIPQGGIVGIVVGALGLIVLALFVTWCCKRQRAKKQEAKWWRLNAEAPPPMVNGKPVRVVENSRNRISPEETEKEWGQRKEGEASPLPSPREDFGANNNAQPGVQWGAATGPKAQYQFAAVSRDPTKMQAARDELLSRGPSGKASHLRVNPNLPMRQPSTKGPKATSPMISSPLEATNPYIIPSPTTTPRDPFGDRNQAIQPPPAAMMADSALNASTMTDPADAWAQQASMFPTPVANVDQRQTIVEPAQARGNGAPRQAQDTVFAIADSYRAGWNRESEYAVPPVPSPPKEPLPNRPARSSSKGRSSQAPSTRGEVVSAFPAPPTGLGLTSRTPSPEGSDAPLPSPRLGTLAATAPLRLSRAKSGSRVPEPITVPSPSISLNPVISSAPAMPPPNSMWMPPLPSPGLPNDRRRSVAMPSLSRQPSSASMNPPPVVPLPARPARNASLKTPNNQSAARSVAYDPPSPRSQPQDQQPYGSALAALTQRSPRVVTSPAPTENSEIEASTPASMDTESAFATTPASSLPATPRDGFFEGGASSPAFDKPTQTTITIPPQAAHELKQGQQQQQPNPGAVFPPLGSMTLDPHKNNYRSAALSIYNLYDQE